MSKITTRPLGETMIEIRRKLVWTQLELADYLGISQGQVSRIEQGVQPGSRPIAKAVDRLYAEVKAGRMKENTDPSRAIFRDWLRGEDVARRSGAAR